MIDDQRKATEGDDPTDDIALNKDTLEDLDPSGSEADVRGGAPDSGRPACIENDGPDTYTGT